MNIGNLADHELLPRQSQDERLLKIHKQPLTEIENLKYCRISAKYLIFGWFPGKEVCKYTIEPGFAIVEGSELGEDVVLCCAITGSEIQGEFVPKAI